MFITKYAANWFGRVLFVFDSTRSNTLDVFNDYADTQNCVTPFLKGQCHENFFLAET